MIMNWRVTEGDPVVIDNVDVIDLTTCQTSILISP